MRRRRTLRPAGGALTELTLYVGGVAVLLAATAGVFVRTAAGQRRADARLAAGERASRVLAQLRTALAQADGAPRVPNAATLQYTDAQGRAVTWSFAGDRLTRTIGTGAGARAEVQAMPVTGRFALRPDGLVYARAEWRWRPGGVVACDTLLRPGGPWSVR